jgi:hypothetical protein
MNRVFNTHARAHIDGVAKKGYFCGIKAEKDGKGVQK